MFSKCYGILYVPQYLQDVFLGFKREYIDLNFTNDVSNEENICRYIEDVLNIKKYEVWWTFLDFDHFKELH
jgi:hypothetical protein